MTQTIRRSHAALLALLLVLALLLSSCEPLGENAHRLTLEGATSAICSSVYDRYPTGEKVAIRAYMPTEGYLRATLDGEEIAGQISGKTMIFSFVMPDRNAVFRLYISEEQGLLLPATDELPDLSGAERKLTFVSLNDTHGSIEQNAAGKMGFSNTKVAIDRLSAFYRDGNGATTERDDLILFANGDMFQGQAVSNMSRGRAVLEAMNEMGFDGMSLGNHEFDWSLETVLAYFDGDETNGEANFPLVISNVTQKSAGKSIADLSDEDNVIAYAIVEKLGVKIGIIGVIGPCENSILAPMVADYRFEDVVESVREAAVSLREAGAELVTVNIHYGNTGDPADLPMNRDIARLKSADGKYLVDVLFNGHSHVRQKGSISRAGGADLPIVQAGADNQYVGYVSVIYNVETKAVRLADFGYQSVADVGTEYDRKVEETVAKYVRSIISSLPALATSAVTIGNKYDYADYTAAIMLQAFDADYSCSNFGGLRGTGGVIAGQAITEANLYEVIPFDNTVYLVTLPGQTIARIMEENGDSWYFGAKSGAQSLASLKGDDSLYTLAVIDYVYMGTYFSPYLDEVTAETPTGIIMRDLLIADVAAQGDAGILWSPQNGPILGQVDYGMGS